MNKHPTGNPGVLHLELDMSTMMTPLYILMPIRKPFTKLQLLWLERNFRSSSLKKHESSYFKSLVMEMESKNALSNCFLLLLRGYLSELHYSNFLLALALFYTTDDPLLVNA